MCALKIFLPPKSLRDLGAMKTREAAAGKVPKAQQCRSAAIAILERRHQKTRNRASNLIQSASAPNCALIAILGARAFNCQLWALLRRIPRNRVPIAILGAVALECTETRSDCNSGRGGARIAESRSDCNSGRGGAGMHGNALRL